MEHGFSKSHFAFGISKAEFFCFGKIGELNLPERQSIGELWDPFLADSLLSGRRDGFASVAALFVPTKATSIFNGVVFLVFRFRLGRQFLGRRDFS